MATVGWTSAYATDIIAVQRVFYNQQWNFSCEYTSPIFKRCGLGAVRHFRFRC